ncbi:putative transcription factor C2H2 family [Rosa chinensis]|uniref:RING-type E3 ubiquitin transferase n=1 Tax=Rosa chinensis TaxID=74649 RepID=A0A2P6P5E4_ROSCH|nr:putative transcription factor C2H2 family [Rosa chinensis]
MAEILTELRVPEFEQPPIIDKIFMAVELADSPEWPIFCLIKDITLFHQTINLAYEVEKVRIDSLEDTVRQQQCVICKESLEHFEGVKEGIDRDQLIIISLSCSHLYHEDCIVQWLAKSQLCPICRYSMPVVKQMMPIVEQAMPVVEEAMPVVEQVAEPSKTSWGHLHWPMLLTASAGGMLTAVLVFRLLKQRQV